MCAVLFARIYSHISLCVCVSKSCSSGYIAKLCCTQGRMRIFAEIFPLERCKPMQIIRIQISRVMFSVICITFFVCVCVLPLGWMHQCGISFCLLAFHSRAQMKVKYCIHTQSESGKKERNGYTMFVPIERNVRPVQQACSLAWPYRFLWRSWCTQLKSARKTPSRT